MIMYSPFSTVLCFATSAVVRGLDIFVGLDVFVLVGGWECAEIERVCLCV